MAEVEALIRWCDELEAWPAVSPPKGCPPRELSTASFPQP